MARRLHRRSVSHLDLRRANEVRVRSPGAIRSRKELELLAHEFHAPWRDSFEDRQKTAGRTFARKSTRPDGPEKHHRLANFRNPEPSPARVRFRTPVCTQNPCEHPVL